MQCDPPHLLPQVFVALEILIKEELLEFAEINEIKGCLGYPAPGS